MPEAPPPVHVASMRWKKAASVAIFLLAFTGGWLLRDVLHSEESVSETQAAIGHLDTALASFELRQSQEIAAIGAELDRINKEMARLASELTASQTALLDSTEMLETLRQPFEAPAEHQSVVYRVRPGDSLSEIAYSLMGSPLDYPLIAEANALESPELILPGQELVIPVLLSERRTRPLDADGFP